MNEPALFWPWPWWSALFGALAVISGSLIAAQVVVHYRNRITQKLGQALDDSGFEFGGETLCLGEGKNAVVVSDDRLAFIDRRSSRVVQTIAIQAASALKIYEQNADRIEFRIVLNSQAQSRKVMTRSIADFAKLFQVLTRAGKGIEYIQE